MPRINPGPPCIVCGKPSQARNLCATHLKRWQRHGHTEQTRPADWGAREKHPLFVAWSWARRQGTVPEWHDFWQFVADIPPRPGKTGRGGDGRFALRRYNAKNPFGPANCFWQERIAAPDHATRMREYRKRDPLRFKGYEVKSRFGITLAEYDALLEKHGGRCAICGNEERVARINGAKFGLAVDHCHKSGKIRGLLCMNCNRGLGHFGDCIERLEKAIAYLRSAE